MNKIDHIIKTLMPFAPMDAIGVGVIDFKKKNFQTFETENGIYFDLASLTKPLTNSLSYFLKPDAFSQDMLLCLNHRGGLPSWGLLSRSNWKEQILSYPIQESETLYSDFSALRVMLELQKKGIQEKEMVKSIWDEETVYWTDLPLGAKLLQYGYKHQEKNFGEVHDPNAYVIGEFCSHAGLFSTLPGLCRTLLSYEEKTGFLSKVKEDLARHSHRFSFGWDRVVDPNNSLAGKGCGKFTFGHLGFTGTSIWIDPEIQIGHVILSNAVKEHWYDKTILNDIRRAVGEVVWSGES